MADAKKCDRCGAFYDRMRDPCKGFILSEYPSNSGLVKVVDLCPECTKLLNLWMDNSSNLMGLESILSVDTVPLENDGLSPCYEYAVFEDGDIFSCFFVSNENDAKYYMEKLKKNHPNVNLHIRKRLKLAWEPVEED